MNNNSTCRAQTRHPSGAPDRSGEAGPRLFADGQSAMTTGAAGERIPRLSHEIPKTVTYPASGSKRLWNAMVA
jgi:hypothetical protein